MDFNFPTMVCEPLLKIDYLRQQPDAIQKKLENGLKKLFKESKGQNRFYLANFNEKSIEVNEFTHDTYFVASMDLLVECYYDPIGNVHCTYTKFNRTMFSKHLESIIKN
jgi:hypothetical protein